MSYDSKCSAPPIARACNLPNPTDGNLTEYLADANYNGKEGRIKPHMRFRTSIRLHELKSATKSTTLYSGPIKIQFRRFLQENKTWFNSQKCSATQVFKQGYFLKRNLADNIDHLRQQLTFRWAMKGCVFDENKWQLSVMWHNCRNPNNKNDFTRSQTIW